MVKKEPSTSEKVKVFLGIIVAIIMIGGSVFGIEKYFAKTSVVKAAVVELKNNDQSLSERLEISIMDDQIFQQEQTIQRIEDWKRFEQRKIEPELTPIEKDTLDKAKKRLSELEFRKEDKIKQYENGNGTH